MLFVTHQVFTVARYNSTTLTQLKLKILQVAPDMYIKLTQMFEMLFQEVKFSCPLVFKAVGK